MNAPDPTANQTQMMEMDEATRSDLAALDAGPAAGRWKPTRDERAPKTMVWADSAAAEYADLLSRRRNGEIRHTPTGLRDLDEKANGLLNRGDLIVFAARPSMGKTALAQQVLEYVSTTGQTVFFFSLEMNQNKIVERAITRRTGIPAALLRAPAKLTSEQDEQVKAALTEFASRPILIDGATRDINLLCANARKAAGALAARGKPPLGLVVVDYLQITDSEGQTREREIAHASAELKRLAKDLDVPVIALSQLNRSLEQRPNKRPVMSDLRDSGGIEQDADVILFIYRDEVYNEDSQDKGTAELIVGKNRDGDTGMVRTAWIGSRVTFGDFDYAHTEPKHEENAATKSAGRRGVKPKARAVAEDRYEAARRQITEAPDAFGDFGQAAIDEQMMRDARAEGGVNGAV